MQKIIDDLKAALEAEAKKAPSQALVIGRELLKQLEARIVEHIDKNPAPAPAPAASPK